jgi:hypothetical protein
MRSDITGRTVSYVVKVGEPDRHLQGQVEPQVPRGTRYAPKFRQAIMRPPRVAEHAAASFSTAYRTISSPRRAYFTAYLASRRSPFLVSLPSFTSNESARPRSTFDPDFFITSFLANPGFSVLAAARAASF